MAGHAMAHRHPHPRAAPRAPHPSLTPMPSAWCFPAPPSSSPAPHPSLAAIAAAEAASLRARQLGSFFFFYARGGDLSLYAARRDARGKWVGGCHSSARNEGEPAGGGRGGGRGGGCGAGVVTPAGHGGSCPFSQRSAADGGVDEAGCHSAGGTPEGRVCASRRRGGGVGVEAAGEWALGIGALTAAGLLSMVVWESRPRGWVEQRAGGGVGRWAQGAAVGRAPAPLTRVGARPPSQGRRAYKPRRPSWGATITGAALYRHCTGVVRHRVGTPPARTCPALHLP